MISGFEHFVISFGHLYVLFKTPNDPVLLELSLLFATSLIAPKIKENEGG